MLRKLSHDLMISFGFYLHCGLSFSDMDNLCKWKIKYFLALLDTWLTFLKAIAKPCSNSDWFSKLESRHGHWALDSTYWTGKSRKMVGPSSKPRIPILFTRKSALCKSNYVWALNSLLNVSFPLVEVGAI